MTRGLAWFFIVVAFGLEFAMILDPVPQPYPNQVDLIAGLFLLSGIVCGLWARLEER